jgi:hypothetical protein
MQIKLVGTVPLTWISHYVIGSLRVKALAKEVIDPGLIINCNDKMN